MKFTTTLSLFAMCSTFTFALPTNSSPATALSLAPREFSCHIRNCLGICGDSEVCYTMCINQPKYASCDFKASEGTAATVVRTILAANSTTTTDTAVVKDRESDDLENSEPRKAWWCPLPWVCCLWVSVWDVAA